MPLTDEPLTDSTPRFGQLLGRFALAGLVAGAASGLFELLVTERAIAPALALEEVRTEASHEHSVEMFGRTTQDLGGFLGTVIAGVVFATVLAAVYAAVRHRLPGRTDVGRTAVLCAVGFAVLALLPALKIPANPPAVGDPDTIGTRTAIYGTVLACGLLIALLVSALVSLLRDRGASASATAAGALALTVVGVVVVLLVVPNSPDTIGADVPAAVVWDFRLASLGQLTVLWTVLGLVSGWLLARLVDPTRADRTELPEPAALRASPEHQGVSQ